MKKIFGITTPTSKVGLPLVGDYPTMPGYFLYQKVRFNILILKLELFNIKDAKFTLFRDIRLFISNVDFGEGVE